jgi:hypothetical protein
LGFEEIDSNVIQTGQLGSGRQIATGDLICYDTQSSRTSCCVHLKPSISTTSTRIPYMSCKYAIYTHKLVITKCSHCIYMLHSTWLKSCTSEK